jgi:hypothetical protein
VAALLHLRVIELSSGEQLLKEISGLSDAAIEDPKKPRT